MNNTKHHQSGQSVLLIVFILSVVFSILLYSSLDLITRNISLQARELDQLLLDETTSSSFAVVEAALQRRLWEPPPDSDCLKAKTFKVKKEDSTGGPEWTVTATYNFETKNYELEASGEYRKLKARFKKQIRVMDVSDYLLFSGGNQDVYLSQRYDPRSPTALIAKSRKVYTNGKLIASASLLTRSNPKTGWTGSPETFPDEYGMILQGERMQFKGGISYLEKKIANAFVDGTTPATFPAMIAPYTSAAPDTYHGNMGGGNLVITWDPNLAEQLKKTVVDPSLGLVSKAQVSTYVYPTALFTGILPLMAATASDTGSYFNETDRYSIFRYKASGDKSTVQGNFSCMTTGALLGTKECSNSAHFPKGFNKWREDTSLSSVLFTSDIQEVPVPEIGWDQLEALEEDAAACGKVVSAPENIYTDCQIWDENFLNTYSLTASKACLQVSELAVDSIALNNFNPTLYASEDFRKRAMRRVIYLKNPTTLKQINASGFLPGVTDANIRSSLSLWVISEKLLTLKGMQPDTTTPLDSEPERLRDVLFNTDALGAVQPIAMTILSTDRIHLLSPFYEPMTDALLEEIYPVTAGKIVPARHNLTDFKRYENDAFRYGYRNYKLKNVSFITNTEVDPSKPFYLQGLWSARDGGGEQYVANQCMVNSLTTPLVKSGSNKLTETALVPAAGSPLFAGPNPTLPPRSSQFFHGQPVFGDVYAPFVFHAQRQPAGFDQRLESTIEFTGGRIHMKFNFTGHPTKADIGVSPYKRIEKRYSAALAGMFNLSSRGFVFDYGRFYDEVLAPPKSCISSNITKLSNHTPDSTVLAPSINDGAYNLIFQAPSDTFRDLGAFTGVDLPIIESKR